MKNNLEACKLAELPDSDEASATCVPRKALTVPSLPPHPSLLKISSSFTSVEYQSESSFPAIDYLLKLT